MKERLAGDHGMDVGSLEEESVEDCVEEGGVD